jgi:hypothetical protein
MTLDAILAFFQTPLGASILTGIGTLAATVAHTRGYNLGPLSALLNALTGQSASPAPAPSPATTNSSHPVLTAVAGFFASLIGQPANSPAVTEMMTANANLTPAQIAAKYPVAALKG